MSKRKLSNDDALALVLSGLKGEIPVSDLCRKYGVSTATYYKLRDQFIAAGTQGLQNHGKTNQIKALELRISELEKALGRKTLEVEVLKQQKILLPESGDCRPPALRRAGPRVEEKRH